LEYYTYLRKYASFPKRLVSILLDEIPLQAAGSLVLEKDFIRGQDLIEIIRAIAEKSLKTVLTLNSLLNGITPAQTKDASWMQELLNALRVWYSINKAEPPESVNEISKKLQALAGSIPALAALLVELGIVAPPKVPLKHQK
nr:hypothetical protein [Candidatus Woesebacteria bacterium]